MQTHIEKVIISSITPYFLEREASWFWNNIKKIQISCEKEGFFKDNILIVKTGQTQKISHTKSKLLDMNYEIVENATFPGQFSVKGGLIKIFPINYENPFVIEFVGDNICNIIKNENEKIDIETAKEELKKFLSYQQKNSEISNLKSGDFVVHIDHGIGIFKEKKYIDGNLYFVIEYAKGDKLYVPENLKNKLSLYIGFENPRIARLGTTAWLKIKKKAREEAKKIAEKLLKIYSKKETSKRPPYNLQDSKTAEKIFAQQANFDLTPDQEKALSEIYYDLEKSTKPMDRLLCGDVGFGKTEIIMRTFLKVVLHGKQAILLCPTSVLAWQHYNLFKKRFGKFPLNIALLTGSKSNEKQLKAIEEGKTDIIIGTHKVLSKKINFKNPGILAIDDEQKFGVLQKEKLRERYPWIDVLYVSATPIPRTLHLTLSRIKDVSFIYTPPPKRQSIETYIGKFDENLMKSAIEKEIERSGQVYILENNIKNLKGVKQKVKNKLKIKASCEIIHAKLPDEKIIDIFERFKKGKLQILISTTIIENGIDISNANTLIIRDVSKLGLGQIYQIRGRVGRGENQAFAYLFYPKWETLSEKAKMRIKALKENLELGSGYKIAIRDMEIRGAGNILGKEQSGPINKVGLNLYCQMISEAYINQNQNL